MVIYRHKEKYSISEMCRFFKVSRSGYYDYVKRMDVPAWDLPLAEKIRECQEHSHSTYGYRRVHIWLERQGIHKDVDYNTAYMREAEDNATSYVEKNYPSQLGLDGGNGWCVATGAHQCSVHGNSDVIKTRPEIVDRSIGNLGFTTQLFWEYYQYTQDKTILEKAVFPILVSAARYIVKLVEEDKNGKYLAFSDSPEMHVNGKWYSSFGVTYGRGQVDIP